MRKLHKGLLFGGVTLAVLVPAGLVAADQIDMGNGHGRGNGRGNGSMTQDCTGDPTGNQTGTQMRARDGSGPQHTAVSSTTPTSPNGDQNQSGPMDGTGNQWRSGR
ncbi:MAG: hypothetical protein Q7V88_19220 [Actinomycetota bacterium]|nr:hypothetical protein [Actinomycetota bacterium]